MTRAAARRGRNAGRSVGRGQVRPTRSTRISPWSTEAEQSPALEASGAGQGTGQ